MKKLFITFLALSFAAKALYQLNYTLHVADMAQINFADTPFERFTPGILVIYAYQGIQQDYGVQAADKKKPTIGRSVSGIRDRFFDSQIKLETDTPKGTLLYKKKIQIDGADGFEYSYSFAT